MEENEKKFFLNNKIKNAFTYQGYKHSLNEELNLTDSSHEDYKVISENIDRIDKAEKNIKINDSLAELLNIVNEKWIWLVLTEVTCDDSAQIIPVIAKITEINNNLSLYILFRRENRDVMSMYLTNGAESIPKLICFREKDLSELGTWGPRPKAGQEILIKHKQSVWDPDKFYVDIHKWYDEDNGISIQNELAEKIKEWSE